MACSGGTDSIWPANWAAACASERHSAGADVALAGLLRHAAHAGRHAFTTQDLRHACSAWAAAQLPVDARRRLHRAVNEARAGRSIAGLTLLLALCGWVDGGEEGAKAAVLSGLAPSRRPDTSQETMRRRPDARRLHPAEAPWLFGLAYVICRRAGLMSMPQLYVLPGDRSMNAYALGTPEDAVITLTDGLLHGMTPDEVAAIMAHEIAHICNDDAATMQLAASLNGAIRVASLSGLLALPGRATRPPLVTALASLLQSAPAIADLLCLGLSRIREIAADALALELIAEPGALAAALEKLEQHHGGASAVPFAADDEHPVSYLRSHPATRLRVDFVRRLA